VEEEEVEEMGERKWGEMGEAQSHMREGEVADGCAECGIEVGREMWD
jgi:hypothetical protein